MPSANPTSRREVMYTVDDIRQRFGVTEATVLGWIHSGELQAVNVGRKPKSKRPRWRISADAVEAFERLRTPTAMPATVRKQRRQRPDDVVEFYRLN